MSFSGQSWDPSSEIEVPSDQRPVNEYSSLKEGMLYSWGELGPREFFIRLGGLWLVTFTVLGVPIAAASFNPSREPLRFALAAGTGTFFLVSLIVLKRYLGCSYVGDRLLSAVIPYEESGWYDGQMWVKPREFSMWFSDYMFLERSWAKDENNLKAGFKRLEDFPMTFWLALFVEGTSFTQEKLEAAQEYASIRSLPSPPNVLIPRTKGFVSAVSHIQSFVPAIYDCTVTVENNQPTPTLLRMFSGQSSEVNLQMRRHKMSELPETDDGIAQWCQDLFITKDAQLEKYFTKDVFSDLDVHHQLKSALPQESDNISCTCL